MASTTTRFASSTRIAAEVRRRRQMRRTVHTAQNLQAVRVSRQANLFLRGANGRSVATSSTLSSTNHARVEISLVPCPPPLPDVHGDLHKNVFATTRRVATASATKLSDDDDGELRRRPNSPGREPPFDIARARASSRRRTKASNRRRRRPLQSSPRWSPSTAFARGGRRHDEQTTRRDATATLSFALVRSRVARAPSIERAWRPARGA